MAARESKGGQNAEQNKDVREGFGDDMGTRVGRPDRPNTDDRSMARLSGESADDHGSRIEGSILDDDGQGSRSRTRADGSSMDAAGGRTLDHTQRAESGTPERSGGASATGADSGMGGEANRGVHASQGRGASVERGTDEGQGTNAGDASKGSEPLDGRKSEHKPSYGGEGGAPRTSSDQREGNLDYYGDKGTGKR